MHMLTTAIAGILLLCTSRAAVVADATLGADTPAVTRCRSMFGPPVRREPMLFEVNQYYALELVVDDHGAVTALNVVPKYWFSEAQPEWEGLSDYLPLTGPECDALLARLDEIRPKGAGVKREDFAVVTNCTAPIRAIYEQAVVVTGEVVDLRRGDDAPRAIRYIEIAYAETTPKTHRRDVPKQARGGQPN